VINEYRSVGVGNMYISINGQRPGNIMIAKKNCHAILTVGHIVTQTARYYWGSTLSGGCFF